MTFRQIAKEMMITKGIPPEEVEVRCKMASAFVAGVDVDREIPAEDVEPLRQHLSRLHDAAMRNPAECAAILQEHMERTQARN
jgi:hypothetical protein